MKFFTFLFILLLVFNVKSDELYFPPIAGSDWDTLSLQSLNWCESKIDNLYNYLDENHTKAFIVLKDGKIVLEKYFGEFTKDSIWYWASAGKTLTAFMAGIAQQEGFLSVNDRTSKYLGDDWTSETQEQEDKITILHQLTMTSGLDDGVKNSSCTEKSCLIYKADAGDRWAYHNAPYSLIDSVIEVATNSTMNNYVRKKLTLTTGITGGFIKLEDYNNVFFSKPRDFARFGLLILNKGNWAGNQIMADVTYFNNMTNTSQELNKSYGYLWWLNGKEEFMLPGSQIKFKRTLMPNAPSDMIAGMGKNGQFVDIVPSQNLVLIRMGDSPENVPVPFLMNDSIWVFMNDLECTTDVSEAEEIPNINIYPNPSSNNISLTSNNIISNLKIYDSLGKIVLQENPFINKMTISLEPLKNGIYFAQITLANGENYTRIITKN